MEECCGGGDEAGVNDVHGGAGRGRMKTMTNRICLIALLYYGGGGGGGGEGKRGEGA